MQDGCIVPLAPGRLGHLPGVYRECDACLVVTSPDNCSSHWLLRRWLRNPHLHHPGVPIRRMGRQDGARLADPNRGCTFATLPLLYYRVGHSPWCLHRIWLPCVFVLRTRGNDGDCAPGHWFVLHTYGCTCSVMYAHADVMNNTACMGFLHDYGTFALHTKERDVDYVLWHPWSTAWLCFCRSVYVCLSSRIFFFCSPSCGPL